MEPLSPEAVELRIEAGEGGRTLNLKLGRLLLCQLSYTRAGDWGSVVRRRATVNLLCRHQNAEAGKTLWLEPLQACAVRRLSSDRPRQKATSPADKPA